MNESSSSSSSFIELGEEEEEEQRKGRGKLVSFFLFVLSIVLRFDLHWGVKCNHVQGFFFFYLTNQIVIYIKLPDRRECLKDRNIH